MTMDSTNLNADDLDFLRRPLHCFFTPAVGATPPQPRPVWFDVTEDGTIQLFAGSGSVRIRNLQKDPRASVVVAAPVVERERWIAVSGRVALASDGVDELCRRLAARYWDLDDPSRVAELRAMLETEQVRITLWPESVKRYSN